MKNPLMNEANDESNQENQGIASSCDVPNAYTELESIENDASKAICNLLTDTDIHMQVPVGPSEPAYGSKM